MNRLPLGRHAIGTLLGIAALLVTPAPQTTPSHPAAALASDNNDDNHNDDNHNRSNSSCDPGYPDGVCVQSPTQSENNSYSADRS
jgi:hypothetical protein